MSEHLQLVLRNNLDELQRLNEEFEAYAAAHDLHVEEQYQVFLCLEELVTNVISYAWPDDGEHTLGILITVDDEFIKVSIEDDGIPFDPTQHPEPDMKKPAAERAVGGLGIHLVRQTMNEMRYSRQEDKNFLVLRKKRKNK